MKIFPGRLIVELTNKCNYQCGFCPRNHISMDEGFMNEHLFRKIIDEASCYDGIKIALFFRGESLLHPQIFEFINYAARKGIDNLQLSSNGHLLTPQITEELLTSGLSFISFSLNTIDKDASLISETNISNSVKQKIETFIEHKNSLKAQGQKTPEIQISTVKSEQSPVNKEFINCWIDKADRVRVYIAHSLDGKFGSLASDCPEKRKPCYKVFNEMAIYWDGNVGICNHDWSNAYYLGNINTSSISDVWKATNYVKLRDMHLTNRFISNLICQDCSQWRMYSANGKLIGELYTIKRDGSLSLGLEE